ncbi:hypothetical protein [Luteibacter sp. RCC_6_2]|uniref:hypothetical protein n=1 Tax=Luteibacter sp. RCC_6_2 TaxID=3239223 RepID=UPI0035249288
MEVDAVEVSSVSHPSRLATSLGDRLDQLERKVGDARRSIGMLRLATSNGADFALAEVRRALSKLADLADDVYRFARTGGAA